MPLPPPHIALISTLFAFGMLGLVFPMARHRLRHGEGTGLMLASLTDPVGRVVGLGMTLQNAAVTAYGVMYALLGEGSLSVWQGAPSWVYPLGLVMASCASLLTVWAQAQMGRSWRMCVDENRTALVVTGLFSFVRNPVYLGSLMLLVAVLLIAPSAWSVCLMCTGTLLVSLQIRIEEAHLFSLHGEQYATYARRVGRLLPKVGRIVQSSGQLNHLGSV